MLNDLLKILEMSEAEQVVWCEKPENGNRGFGESLAEVAFRLRDEVRREKGNYDHAVYIVFNYEKQKNKYDNVFYWMAYIAKPIHWIIAALIAKEQK